MTNISTTINLASHFIDRTETDNGYKLFLRSECSPYARCFSIFTKSLIRDFKWLEIRKENLVYCLNRDLNICYKKRLNDGVDWKYDKPFLQLFCFTLSSLDILKGELDSQNLKILYSFLKININKNLSKKGIDIGLAGTGNHSMFVAILNIYANDYLGLDRTNEINAWKNFNLNSINSNGFWGDFKNMTYLQFQNGYHQYEIFEYLNLSNPPWKKAAKNVLKLSDNFGHFAPYPGGGGCYDYDATFMLTSKFVGDIDQETILNKTLKSILYEQNDDGGFCESKLLKNNEWPRVIQTAKHILSQPKHVRIFSVLTALNLLRLKHRYVSTHWTKTDRRWNESNSWDTFFRLSTINRICKKLDMPEKEKFNESNFPGIG